jgi:hypothetical protein
VKVRCKAQQLRPRALLANHNFTACVEMISIAVSVPRARLPVGWGVPLNIVVENKSGRALRWALDDPPNIAPDEFLTGIQVFDAAGEICPPPEPPNPDWSISRFRDTVSEIVIPLASDPVCT